MSTDYKVTMNLPHTDFSMRAGLPQSEPKRLEKWYEMDLYHKVLEKNRGNTSYILHDGPPYANGPIHIGHAFNKILKDFIVKYKSQRGFFAPYVPGWDCHGQPIEHMIETKLGQEKMAKIDQVTLRRLCRDWATQNIDLQREGFKRLGVLGEWDDPYLTYKPEYEAGNIEIFKKMYLDGSLYRGRKPIHWCYHCHTALAEAEIEYGDETSPSIYVAFKLTAESADALARSFDALNKIQDSLHILIWTTTPWTLPANTAVSVAPDAQYAFVKTDDKTLIIARELVDSVASVAEWQTFEILKDNKGNELTVKGTALEGLKYSQPIFNESEMMIVVGDHVELSTGTGAVHTAPGHGQEDYLVGEKYSLPTLMPVDDNGIFDAGGGPFEGLNVVDANPKIIAWLTERSTLVARKNLTHSYPHCWRCHNPVIFRATEQWFVSMDSTGLRKQALSEIDSINWYPQWASNRLRSMVEGRPDWTISRQRSWGVPIPVFKCESCGNIVATAESFDAVIELFKSEGADAWFTRLPKDYLPASVVCGQCGSNELAPEKDILDVWWESGVSHTSVLDNYDDLSRPADLYLEGSDQHRGWFQSSLLTSVGTYGKAPYKGVMSCGFTMDENGEKMSKSKGNGVDPADVFNSYGADVLRLWVGSVDSSQDANIGKNILDRTADAYRRIRNTFRFLLSNLNDFNGSNDLVSFDEMLYLDRWALCRAHVLMKEVDEAYESFRFHQAYHAIYDYVVTDLSSVYLDAIKDRLYSDAPKSLERRSAQIVLAHVLEILVRQLAPILSFTCDEVWEFYPEGLREKNRPCAVALAGWPSTQDFSPRITPETENELMEVFDVVLSIRDAVTKALEDARDIKTITKSQEAKVDIATLPSVAAVLDTLPKGTLEELLIVSEVNVVSEASAEEPQIIVAPANGEKCPRCWNYRTLGLYNNHPEVCERCAAVLTELGFNE